MAKNKKSLSLIKLILSFTLFVAIFVVGIELGAFIDMNKNNNVEPKNSQSNVDAELLQKEVVPVQGYSLSVDWGDLGQKLIRAGAIDKKKFGDIYKSAPEMSYLNDSDRASINVDNNNAYFWVNTLWALGLTQKSDVLTKGIMNTKYKDTLGNFASTAGWTLGTRDALSLYSSQDFLGLTPDDQNRVTEVSKNIYRPCCGNPTSFPDCNHGMAILGLIELMVKNGYSDADIYKASLAFNSYWFADTYVDLAYYFKTKKGLDWEDVDPKVALSAEYSSAQGYQTIKEQIGTVPGSTEGGASCGA